MRLTRQVQVYAIVIVVISILVGTTITVFSPGEFLSGLWRSALFSLLLLVITAAAFWYLKPERIIIVIAALAFLVRLAVGIGLYRTLPANGYDTDAQNAGYSYSDAFVRDQGSYWRAFPEKVENVEITDIYVADQYGGLSMISVTVYRLFSADLHRPLLMICFSAFAFALAVLFTWKAILLEWGAKVALIAVIVLAAYPEGILLGSSQMREPVLIALAAVSFWAIVSIKQGKREPAVYILFGVATLLACWISIPAGLVILMVETGFLIQNWIARESDKKRKQFKIVLFAIFIVATLFTGWGWLKNTLYYDAYLTETESGMVAYIIKIIGTQWRIPFVLLYGLIQPVLPAALVYQSLPVWKGIAVFRAVGWYFAIPFLLYGIGGIWKDARKNQNCGLLWLTFLMLVWVFVSSARAGGDQWDNPRYRTIFLPWLVLIMGWVWQHLRQTRAAWFWRIVFLEGVFILLFTNWYFNRILAIGIPIPINMLLIIYSALLVTVIVVGVILDHKRKKSALDNLPLQ
jgi:hypothetical protein